ncbi:MAG: HNH endonuclease [Elusimicrobiota bacterium]
MSTKSYRKKKRLRKKADKLYFEALLKSMCEACGKKATQVHHFFPKGQYGHLRYDEDNAISLCPACHFAHHHKGDPEIHIKVIENRGEKWFEKLREKAHHNPKSFKTIDWYKKQIEKFQLK